MSQQAEESVAQFVDRFLQRSATGVLLVGTAYALSAVMYFVGDEVSGYLSKVTLVLGILAVISVLPVFIKMVRLRSNKQCNWSGSDSYMMGVFNKACVSAFEATFIFLIVLEPLSKKFLTEQPTNFFINVVLAVAASVLGLAFFFRTRRDEAELEDDLDPGS